MSFDVRPSPAGRIVGWTVVLYAVGQAVQVLLSTVYGRPGFEQKWLSVVGAGLCPVLLVLGAAAAIRYCHPSRADRAWFGIGSTLLAVFLGTAVIERGLFFGRWLDAGRLAAHAGELSLWWVLLQTLRRATTRRGVALTAAAAFTCMAASTAIYVPANWMLNAVVMDRIEQMSPEGSLPAPDPREATLLVAAYVAWSLQLIALVGFLLAAIFSGTGRDRRRATPVPFATA